MFKHKIKYEDFNGVERNEDFYFHLSLPEVVRIEAEIGRPIDEHTRELAGKGDVKELIAFLEMIILSSYGRKTSDGKSFIKNKDLRAEFEYSQAYAEIFEQLLTVEGLAERFGTAVADNKKKKNQVPAVVVPQ